MEEEGKTDPSLPPNYVSLVQLRERWLKEKGREQKEKEEEQRNVKEKEERLNSKLKENRVGKSEAKTRSVRNRRYHRNHRYKSENYNPSAEATVQKSEELVIDVVEVQMEERADESGKKKKDACRVGEDVAEGNAQAPHVSEEEKKIPAVVNACSRELKNVRSHFQRKGYNKGKNGGELEKVNMANEAAEMSGKVEHLSIDRLNVAANYGSNSKCRGDSKRNGYNQVKNGGELDLKIVADKTSEMGGKLEHSNRFNVRSDSRAWGRFGPSRPGRPRDASLVWVRKEEVSCSCVGSSGANAVVRDGEEHKVGKEIGSKRS